MNQRRNFRLPRRSSMASALGVLAALLAWSGPSAPWNGDGWGVPHAEAAANPFRVEVAGVRAVPGKSAKAEVRVVVPEGFHVYRDMLWVKVIDDGGLQMGAASFPPGLMRPDPASPGSERELYDMDVIIHVPLTAPKAAGNHIGRIEVGYQGCKGGLCYMPATEQHDVVVEVASTSPAPPPAPAPAPAPAAPAEGVSPGAPGSASAAPQSGTAPQGWREGAWVSQEGGAVGAAAFPMVDFSMLPASASVQKFDSEGRPHPVHARLLLDHEKVAPGQHVRLGVHLTQKEGWHTYWHSPGDIGLPTDIQWSLPPGVSASPYLYPVPHRYDVQGIISYGYDDQVMFFTEFDIPKDMPAGPVTLGAHAKWLVCEVMCIPGEAELSLPVEVVTDAEPHAGSFSPLFDAFAATHPVDAVTHPDITVETALSDSALQPDSPFRYAIYVKSTNGKPISFDIGEGGWPAFAPIYSSQWMVSGVNVQSVDGGLLAVVEGTTFAPDPLPPTEKVGGLVQLKVGDKPVRAEILVNATWALASAPVVANPSPLFALAEGASTTKAMPQPTLDPTPAVALAPPVDAGAGQSLPFMLLLAFLGGAILNVMPCVLPVLTLKLYSLVEQQDQLATERRKAGLAYTAGVVASFLALAVAVVALRSVFSLQVGWGFQFQYPEYVAALATIVFVFGLSLFGVFEVPALGANSAAEASEKEGLLGHFLTGTFTTLLATPCSAPLLGTGMGFAFGLPAWGVLLFFAVAALGLASPFLLIAFVPALMRFLPRPGAWMETFKQAMGFTLVATTVWLVDVMGGLVGRDGLVGFLGFLVAVAAGAWIFGRWGGPIETGRRQLAAFFAGVVLSAVVGWKFLVFEIPEDASCADTSPVAFDALDWSEKDIPWQPFSDQRVVDLRGNAIFIDFTADWCLTCKVNEKGVLNTEAVRSVMQQNKVIPLKADWTRKDEVITSWLQRYGRAGVPFYLVIPADPSQAPIPLPEVITADIVNEALAKAAKK